MKTKYKYVAETIKAKITCSKFRIFFFRKKKNSWEKLPVIQRLINFEINENKV